jgi:uncharacterized protein YdaU (DUF1376 family)
MTKPTHRPWYSWFPGDYAADTKDLSCLEHGCYRLLLDASWCMGPLQADLERLSRLAAGCPTKVVRFILERFWILTDNGWVNQRLERERILADRYISASSRGGQRSSEVRKLKYGSSQPNPPSNPPSNHPSNPPSNPPSDLTSKSTPKIPHPHPHPHPQQIHVERDQVFDSVVDARARARESPKRGTHIPKDWVPSPELLAWAQVAGLNGSASLEADNFKDYWLARADKAALKRDWNAAYRTWVRRAIKDQPPPLAPQQPKRHIC